MAARENISLQCLAFEAATTPNATTGLSYLHAACINNNDLAIQSILICSPTKLDTLIALSTPVVSNSSIYNGLLPSQILQADEQPSQESLPGRNMMCSVYEKLTSTYVPLQYQVARFGSIRHLKKLQFLGFDINKASTDKEDAGTTLLMLAAASNTRKVLEFLIVGGNVHAKGHHGKAALHYASSTGNIETLRCLLERGANVNEETTWGRTPLHVASRNGMLCAVTTLVEWGGDILAKTVNQDTPLILAAEKGHLGVVEFLILKGSNVNDSNLTGCTAMHFVAKQGHLGVASLLIQNGSSINVIDKSDHQIPLFNASGKPGNLEMVQFLLEEGSEINTRDKHGRTALHFAGDRDIAELLVQYRSDPETRDYSSGSTPIFHAAANGYPDVVDFLIDQGFDAQHAKNIAGESPLHGGVRSGHKNVALRLIEYGCNVNLKAMLGGVTPLILAVLAGNQDMVQCLIEKGAIVDDADNWQSTPLHKAVEWNTDVDIILCLLSYGASASIQDSRGETPLDIANRLGKACFAEILMQAETTTPKSITMTTVSE